MKRFMKLFIKINSKAKNNMNFNSPPWFVSHELRPPPWFVSHEPLFRQDTSHTPWFVSHEPLFKRSLLNYLL
jgi:hypothetical protein